MKSFRYAVFFLYLCFSVSSEAQKASDNLTTNEWNSEKGILLHYSAGISNGNSLFNVEMSCIDNGFYTISFVLQNAAFNASEEIDDTFFIEVYDSAGELYYNDSGFLFQVAGLPGIYILESAEQLFQTAKQHSWLGALKDGHRLVIKLNDEPSGEYVLKGSKKTITALFEACIKK